ncbi:hypothetical protein [Sphingomonas pruni]|uniref:hypothetical protein n=1 Tax=Sphingomonas pruni TaxID=40683 RepID=UPI001FE2178D|nr:hypothetical protein [Sphingomonas pruni]
MPARWSAHCWASTARLSSQVISGTPAARRASFWLSSIARMNAAPPGRGIGAFAVSDNSAIAARKR